MDDGFHIRLGQLREHAGTVEELAGQADVAARAGQQIAGLDNAYGLDLAQRHRHHEDAITWAIPRSSA